MVVPVEMCGKPGGPDVASGGDLPSSPEVFLCAHPERREDSRDLRAGSEVKRELVAIRREEPDPALFEIPKDFEVNPARLPIAKDFGVVRPSKE
jgi:hypothetical protein